MTPEQNKINNLNNLKEIRDVLKTRIVARLTTENVSLPLDDINQSILAYIELTDRISYIETDVTKE